MKSDSFESFGENFSRVRLKNLWVKVAFSEC